MKPLIVLFAGAMLCACSRLVPDRSEPLVAAVSRAAGGLAAAQAIPALAWDLHIREATFEVDARYLVDRAGRMRIDIYSGGSRVFTECFDGHAAWQMTGDGTTTPASADGRAALWHGTQYPGQILDIAEFTAHGHRIRAAGSEVVDGATYDVLELTLSDGFTTSRYVDRATRRIVRGRDVRAPHPDIDARKLPVETVWSDFRMVDGVLRPFRAEQRNLADGTWQQTATVNSVRRLAALPDSLFVPGSAPMAL